MAWEVHAGADAHGHHAAQTLKLADRTETTLRLSNKITLAALANSVVFVGFRSRCKVRRPLPLYSTRALPSSPEKHSSPARLRIYALQRTGEPWLRTGGRRFCASEGPEAQRVRDSTPRCAAQWSGTSPSLSCTSLSTPALRRGRVVRAPAIPDDKAERLLASLLAAAHRKDGTAGAPISTSRIR